MPEYRRRDRKGGKLTGGSGRTEETLDPFHENPRPFFRKFCDEVARATTFTGAEVEAVLRLAAEIAKRHVENGDIVEFGDIGTLTPSFQSKLVEKGKTEFNPNIHITKPVVRLSPSRKYFTLSNVSYERVEAPVKKTAKPKPSGGGGTTEGQLP